MTSSGCSDTFRGEIAGRPSLAVDDRSNSQLLEAERDVDAWLPLAQRATRRKQQMETACANVTHVSWLNAFEVGERGRLPGDRVRSGGIVRKGKGGKCTTRHAHNPVETFP